MGVFQDNARKHRYHGSSVRDVMHAGDRHTRPNVGKVSLSEDECVLAAGNIALGPQLPSAGLRGTREAGFHAKPRYAYYPSECFNEVRRGGRTVRL